MSAEQHPEWTVSVVCRVPPEVKAQLDLMLVHGEAETMSALIRGMINIPWKYKRMYKKIQETIHNV